jgi:hypothetical protein
MIFLTRCIVTFVVVVSFLMSSVAGHTADTSSSATPPQLDTEDSVSTLDALRTLARPQTPGPHSIMVLGYGPSDPYGGGRFIWSDSDTLTDDDGMTIAPTSQPTAGRWVRDLADPGVISPLYFGARCDGTDDDAPAINKAAAFIRKQYAHGDLARLTGILRLPSRECLLKTTVNATGLHSAGVMIEGTGGSLICRAQGQPCIDAMDSGKLGMRDVTIYGDPHAMPSIGLQLGRPSPKGSAAGMYLDHVTISGFFSFTAFYNLNAETQLDLKLNASNQAKGGYGAVYDGLNHWHATSAFVNITSPVDTPQSFNDNSCINCRITSIGEGGVPLWAGGTDELTFENSYISNFSAGVGAVLYNWDVNLNFDAHFEAQRLTHVFLLAGKRNYRLYGLVYREHDFFATRSMFGLDTGVRSASLENVDINIGRIHGDGTWFDDPRRYTVSGRVAGVYHDGWVTPGGGFSGLACFGATCTFQQ